MMDGGRRRTGIARRWAEKTRRLRGDGTDTVRDDTDTEVALAVGPGC